MAEVGQLAPGVNVTLNSGSPHLTVTELRRGGEIVAVAWFDPNCGIPQEAAFPIACVKLVESA